MADPPFEQRLQQLFAHAPPAPDAALFSRRVEERLNFRWSLRRLVIGLAAAGSALVAAGQLAASAVVSRVLQAGQAPLTLLEDRWRVLETQAEVLRAIPVPGELGWIAAGLVIVVVGLGAMRAVDEG